MTGAALDSRTLSSALGAGGALTTAYDSVWDALWTQSVLPAQLLELCRLRLARLHGAHADMRLRLLDSLAERRIECVLDGSYHARGDFSVAERAALEFTEVYAQDPAAIDDALADAVKEQLGEPGLVCLVQALGFIDGRIRLAQIFTALGEPGH